MNLSDVSIYLLYYFSHLVQQLVLCQIRKFCLNFKIPKRAFSGFSQSHTDILFCTGLFSCFFMDCLLSKHMTLWKIHPKMLWVSWVNAQLPSLIRKHYHDYYHRIFLNRGRSTAVKYVVIDDHRCK